MTYGGYGYVPQAFIGPARGEYERGRDDMLAEVYAKAAEWEAEMRRRRWPNMASGARYLIAFLRKELGPQ